MYIFIPRPCCYASGAAAWYAQRATQYSRTWPEVWLSTTALRVNRGSRRVSRVERTALVALLEAGVVTEPAPPSECPVPPSWRCCLADLEKRGCCVHSTRGAIFFLAPEVKQHQMYTGRTIAVLLS